MILNNSEDDSTDDEDDEDDEYEDCEYQGVDYIINKNNDKIYNDDFELVGKYAPTSDKITNIKWKNKNLKMSIKKIKNLHLNEIR